MDNKRWYKRFGSVFWWCLTILPLIVALIYFIGYHLTFNSGINTSQALADYHSLVNGNFLYFLEDILQDNSNVAFVSFNLPFINEMFYNLFDLLGVESYDYLAILFGWMCSIQFYHLLFDFIVWFPRWCHNMLEKGVGKID